MHDDIAIIRGNHYLWRPSATRLTIDPIAKSFDGICAKVQVIYLNGQYMIMPWFRAECYPSTCTLTDGHAHSAFPGHFSMQTAEVQITPRAETIIQTEREDKREVLLRVLNDVSGVRMIIFANSR